MENKIHKLIIIGSGPAGLTAAIYAARANLEPIIIDGDEPGGQLVMTSFVENWPGEKSILGPKLMANMRDHAKSFGTQFIAGRVTKVDFSKKPLTITVNEHTTLQTHAIIIATGATPKRLGVAGEENYWGKGVTTCAVCDGAFYPDKKVVVVGGGDTAMEDASFLKKFTKKITIVHILDKFTASHAMQERVINDPDIKVYYSSTVTEFHGDGQHVNAVTITNQLNGETMKLEADGVFIAIGLSPNSAPFKDHITCDKWGFVEAVNQTHTNVEGVFVAGDVHDYRYRQAITSAGAGCMAALDAERYLSSSVEASSFAKTSADKSEIL
ncbi:MAG TPA: thioredoxin-disulfide reductase [Candidatus Babeliales bacterium]|jgi:thioredoxin reductase (NADPH)|nr:thioredoxin-disulfide reductase [Candidatus Babeliales bacterium]